MAAAMNATNGIFGTSITECQKFLTCGCGKLLEDKPPAGSKPMSIIISKKEMPISAPAPPVRYNYNGRTAAPVEFFLHHAARRGDANEVARLAKAGIDLDSEISSPSLPPSLPLSLFRCMHPAAWSCSFWG
jgi:hypothetical protein